MTYNELHRLASEMGAKDADHICEIANLAVLRKGEDGHRIVASIKRNQPRLFFNDAPTPRGNRR